MIESTFKSGKKVTANQFAKEQILDALDARNCSLLDNCDEMTEREKEMVAAAYEKQLNRVAKLLGGFQKVYGK